jgi:hypothetical protein
LVRSTWIFLLNVPLPVTPETLRPGPNTFAVELHQFETNDLTKFLAVELAARAESLLVGPLLWLGGPGDVVAQENQPATLSRLADRCQ